MQGTDIDFRACKIIKDDDNSWKFIPAEGGGPGYYLYTVKVQKSAADDREYRIIRLENGLEAILVQDGEGDKAAACMRIAVGDFQDPDDMPGLAHFCEHLLFMGTKQYRKENEYDEYLSKNNGESNASTGACDTTYFFSVASDALEGALKRFSSFFHSPLFSESCVMRELDAIDAENSLSMQDDEWRVSRIIRHLARPGHPMQRSGIGSKKTLMQGARSARGGVERTSARTRPPGDHQSRSTNSTLRSSAREEAASREEKNNGKEIRRRVIEWWKREYCANRMKLSLIGKDSLDDLTRLAVKYFSPIKNRGRDPLPRVSEPPFGQDQKSIVYAKTVSDVNSISIMFPIPDQAPLWRVKPSEFLAHLIGHEGPRSLHAYLKNKGWLVDLVADTEELGRGYSSFELSVELTKEGFKNYREVIQTFFKNINLLRSSELPKWFQEELITLDALEFRFEEKCSADYYAYHLASLMELPVPRALMLSGPKLTWEWDKTHVQETLRNLVIQNALIVVPSQNHEVIGKDGPWLAEPWFGTKYMVEKLDGELIRAACAENDIPELALPAPNEFIPSNIEVERKKVVQPKKRPALIKRTPLMDVWFKKDDQFWMPRAMVTIAAQTPVASLSASEVVMTRLFAYLVEDALTDYSYAAQLAGLFYDFGATRRGVSFSLGGYNDKLYILAKHVMEKARLLDVREDRLELMKEKVQQELSNVLLSEPNILARFYLSYLLLNREFTIEEEFAEIPLVTVEKIREHIRRLYSELKFTILINGNLWRKDALEIASMTERILNTKAISEKKLVPERARILPEGCNYVWELPVPNVDERNSCVSYYCYIGRYSDARLRVITSLLSQILCEPAFDILRTKEQVAYSVKSGPSENVEAIGWHILVQSEKDPRFVETRIEAFLVHIRGVLEKMPDDEFKEHKASLKHDLKEKLKNMMEETSLFWSSIRSGYFDFQRRERDAEVLDSIDKNEIMDVFKKFLDPESPSRSKLSVHMRSQNPSPPKLSLKASAKFFSLLEAMGVAVDEDEDADADDDDDGEEDALSVEDLPVDEAREHWQQELNDQFGKESPKTKWLMKEFDELVKKYPEEGYEPVELDPKVVFIKDGTDFRESLTLSAPAKPVEEFEVEAECPHIW